MSISCVLQREKNFEKIAGSNYHTKLVLKLLTIPIPMENSSKFVRIMKFSMIL